MHEDPDLFREALTFTAADTAFSVRLIEKDYFCSRVLASVGTAEAPLVFKGGTCLAKVHAGFYRLSEDLDFVIPINVGASRADRRRSAASMKRAVADLPVTCPDMEVVQPMIGANDSTQYLSVVAYRSLMSGQQETIKIEVGLREPLLQPVMPGMAGTCLLDPITHRPMEAPFPVRCIAKEEGWAEKFRAALSRREVAIRDFFDRVTSNQLAR